MVDGIQKFDAIKYTTQYGENCVATKKDGIVTIQGDKNGVRQMPLDDFMKAFVKDQAKVQMERSPEKDSVKFTGRPDVANNKKSHKAAIGAIALSAIGIGALIISRRINSLLKEMSDAAAKSASDAIDEIAKQMTEDANKFRANMKSSAEEIAQKAEDAVKNASEEVAKATDKVAKGVAEDKPKARVQSVPLKTVEAYQKEAAKATDKPANSVANGVKPKVKNSVEDATKEVKTEVKAEKEPAAEVAKKSPKVSYDEPLLNEAKQQEELDNQNMLACFAFDDIMRHHNMGKEIKIADNAAGLSPKKPILTEAPKTEVKTELPSLGSEIKAETKSSRIEDTSNLSKEEPVGNQKFDNEVENSIEDVAENKSWYGETEEPTGSKLVDDVDESYECKSIYEDEDTYGSHKLYEDTDDSLSSIYDDSYSSSYDEPIDSSSFMDDVDNFF